MLQEITNKEAKKSSTGICSESKNNFDELKMFQVHRNHGDGQSRSLVFKISRIVNKPASTSDSAKENRSYICFEKPEFGASSMYTSSSETKIPHSTAVQDENVNCRQRSDFIKENDNEVSSFGYGSTCLQTFDVEENSMSEAKISHSTAVKDENNKCERSISVKENELQSFNYVSNCFEESSFKKNNMSTSTSATNNPISTTDEKVERCEQSDTGNEDKNKLLAFDYESTSFKMSDVKDSNMTPGLSEAMKPNYTTVKVEKFKGNEQSDSARGNKDDLPSSDYGSTYFKESDLKENNTCTSSPDLKIYSTEVKDEKMKSCDRSDLVRGNESELLSCEPTCFEKLDIKENNMTTNFSGSEDPNFTAIKDENTKGCERRRSLRLIELQSKINSSQSSENKNQNANEFMPKKRNARRTIKQEKGQTPVNESTPKVNKRGRKRKPSTRPLPSKVKKIKMSDKFQNPSKLYIDPSKMRLKGMMLIPGSGKPSSPLADGPVPERHDDIYLKFANVDTSRVLSNLNHQENICESLTSKKAVSLFFPREFNMQMTNPVQNVVSPNETSAHQYSFKKAKFDLLYLCKKYHMIDFSTLDKCYGLSNCSVRKTEIMLSDIISGKEVILTRNQAEQHFSYNLTPSEICYNDLNSPFYMPFTYGEESIWCENLEFGFWDRDFDSLCRKIIVQSMEILYSEEAVS